MKRSIALSLFAVVVAALALPQQGPDMLALYRNNFRNANRPVKLELLRSAQNEPAEQLGPFYEDAARYIATNLRDLASDPRLQEMLQLTNQGAAASGHTATLEPFWYIFEGYREARRRLELLDTFREIGSGNSDLIVRLTGWLESRNEEFRLGSFTTDLRVIDAAVRTLGEFGDPRSFAALMDAAIVGYSGTITAAARNALQSIDGSIVEHAVVAFRDKPVEDKLEAFDFFFRGDDLSPQQKDEFVTAALDNVLSARIVGEETLPMLRQMRYQANIYLRDREYAPATEALIGHFNRTYAEFDRGDTPQAYLIEAIEALGAMGTEAAARRLTEFLDLINRYTEFERPFNTDITLATLRNLERIGSAVAYNSLFYTTLLNYPPRVKNSARQAMQALNR